MRHMQLISLIGFSILLAGCGGSGSGAKNDDKGAASGGGGKGFAQKVLNLDEKSYVGGLRKSGSRKGTLSINNGGAGKGPLAKNGGTYSLEKAEHSAGTMADAFQALLMLRPAQCVYYDSNQNGKCYGMGALDLSPPSTRACSGSLMILLTPIAADTKPGGNSSAAMELFASWEKSFPIGSCGLRT